MWRRVSESLKLTNLKPIFKHRDDFVIVWEFRVLELMN